MVVNNLRKIISSKVNILIVAIFLVLSCNKERKLLNQSLLVAGKNKTELEKVLHHYKNDSLKLKAAEFLITNMPGSFSENPEILEICTPFYIEYDSLAKEYQYTMNVERGGSIDSL